MLKTVVLYMIDDSQPEIWIWTFADAFYKALSITSTYKCKYNVVYTMYVGAQVL